MPDSTHIPIELNNWLHIATQGNEKPVRDKLRAEAIARYQEARNQELASGATEPQARDRAIQALGDPWTRRSESFKVEGYWHQDILAPLKNWRRRRKLREPSDLESWLAIATFDLCEAAKARARIELQAHIEDAQAALQEEELSPEQARIAALAGLGSAQAARRHFNQSYVTQSEYELIERTRQDDRPLKASITKYAAFFLIYETGFILPWLLTRSVFLPILLLFQPISLFCFFFLTVNGKNHVLAHFAMAYRERRAEQRYKLARAVLSAFELLVCFQMPHSIMLLTSGINRDEIMSLSITYICGYLLVLIVILRSPAIIIQLMKKNDNTSNPGGPDAHA